MTLKTANKPASPAESQPALALPEVKSNTARGEARPGRPSNDSVAEKARAIAKAFADLRETIKVVWRQTAIKLFAMLEKVGADPLDPEEIALINEAVNVNVDLIGEDRLEAARRFTRWASVAVAVIILLIKVWSIFSNRRRKQTYAAPAGGVTGE